MKRNYLRLAQRVLCAGLVLIGTVALSPGPSNTGSAYASSEVRTGERMGASSKKWEVRLEPGRPNSEFQPRYSPGGTRLVLTAVSIADLEGYDPLEGHIRLADDLTGGEGQRFAVARSREGIPYDRLWIDRDHDGSLEDETPVVCQPHMSRAKWWSSFATSIQVTQTLDGVPFREKYPLSFWITVDQQDERPAQILFSRRGFLSGRVQIDGQDYDVVLSDRNNDALYGAGDWWEIRSVSDAKPTWPPREIPDFSWAGDAAFTFELADSTGRRGWVARYDPGVTREEDEATRDRFHEDRTAPKASRPIAFRHDVDKAVTEAHAAKARYFLDFETSWCGYCKQMDQLVYTARKVVDAAQEIVCIKVDGDQRQDLVLQFGVRGYPTGILFAPDGTELARFSGYRSVEQMTAFFGTADEASGASRFFSQLDSLVQEQSWAAVRDKVAARMADHPEDMAKLVDLAAFKLAGASDSEAREIAEQILDSALAEEPDSTPVLRSLSYLAANQGRYEEAVALNRRLLAAEPDRVEFLNNLAWILSDNQQQYDEALPLAAKAIGLAPDDTHALDTYGVICFQLGRFDEAERSLDRAVRLETAAASLGPVSRYHLAQVYEATDRAEKAADLFRASLNLHDRFGGLTADQVAHARRVLKNGLPAGGGDTEHGQAEVETVALFCADDAINDKKIREAFRAGLTRLVEQGRVTPPEMLVGQLDRAGHRITLPSPAPGVLSAAELYKSCRGGVLVVGHLYRCKQCGRIHVGTAGGIALTASGVIATNYHVVKRADSLAMGAMTTDGRVYAVRAVLAADSPSDVAILQLDGDGLSPLALSADAPAGTPVVVIGHPNGNFYTLTPGMISRHFVANWTGRDVAWIAATAEIGRGSSGAPMLNESGAVVGMASRTKRFDGETDDHEMAPQVTFCWFVPAGNILKLIQDEPVVSSN